MLYTFYFAKAVLIPIALALLLNLLLAPVVRGLKRYLPAAARGSARRWCCCSASRWSAGTHLRPLRPGDALARRAAVRA